MINPAYDLLAETLEKQGIQVEAHQSPSQAAAH